MSDADLEIGAAGAFCQVATLNLDDAKKLLDAVGVRAQDFADKSVSAVWAVVESMVRDNRTPDFFTVQSKLPNINRRLLSKLLLEDHWTRRVFNADERLKAVLSRAKRRRATQALDRVRSLIVDEARGLPEVSAEAFKALELIRTEETSSATLDSEVLAYCDRLDEIAQGRREAVLPTGIEALDAVIGGLQPTLTVIGALPGVGKSALLAAVLRNLAARGVKTGFFSLEDERQWLVARLIAEAADVPLFVLQNKPLVRSQQDRVAVAIEKLYKDLSNVVVDDRPGLTTADVVASARDMIVRHKARALLIDHLGEIRLQRSDRHDLDIADALQQLRMLAKTYRVPVVVACHLRRRDGLNVDAEPKLTDFAFSAAVERMSRVALGLSKPNEDCLKVHVLKQTNGRAHIAVELEMNGPAAIVANAAAPSVKTAIERLYAGQEEA